MDWFGGLFATPEQDGRTPAEFAAAYKRYRVSSSIFRGSKPGKYVPRNTKDFLLTAYYVQAQGR